MRQLKQYAPDPYTLNGSERGPVIFPAFKADLGTLRMTAQFCDTCKSLILQADSFSYHCAILRMTVTFCQSNSTTVAPEFLRILPDILSPTRRYEEVRLARILPPK